MNTDNLVKKFAEAGVKLVIEKTPISRVRDNRDTFQMDIKRKGKGPNSEYFAIWVGAEENLAVVQGVDSNSKQLVLMIKETQREFLDLIPAHVLRHQQQRWGGTWQKEFAREHGEPQSAVVKKGNLWYLRRNTTDRKRHFLLGRDERQLFMCQLPKACTTVAQAHDCLKAPTLRMFGGQIPGKTFRQGEWFFINPSDEALKELEEAIKQNRAVIKRKVSIGSIIRRAGKPHVAEETVCRKLLTKYPGSESDTIHLYVRGSIRHSDHKTLKFSNWRRVVKNGENTASQSLGGSWID